MMKKLLALVLSVLMMVGVIAGNVSAANTDTKLTFNEDGSFKIMHVCDIQDGPVLSKPTAAFLAAVVASEQPDLIVLGGDNISGGSCGTKTLGKSGIRSFMSIFDSLGVPVLTCFGNHDEEGALTKEEMLEVYSEFDCFIGYDDGEGRTGCANNSVQIYDNSGRNILYNIYAIDSNAYNADGNVGGYDYVHEDQIDWYRAQRDAFYARTGSYVPSMVFQHIIVPQIYELFTPVDYATSVSSAGRYLEPTDAIVGEVNESPCPPNITVEEGYAELEAMLEKGDVQAMFFGHDHVNSFVADYQGVDLVNTPGAGFNSYGGDNRGVRVITLDESDLSTYDTEVIEYLDYYAGNEAMTELFKAYASEYSFFQQVEAFFKYIWFSFTALFEVK